MIGAMKHRITLQEPVLTPDGGGGFAETWEDVEEVYAAIAAVTAGEALRFHKLEATVTHRITIRHRADVTPRLRVVHGGAAYDIVAIQARGARYMDILAVLQQGDA